MNSTSGTSANGMPNERTTWLSTSARVGATPRNATIRAGAAVIARRANSGICRWMKPCITICPASVPTDDEERPDASRATPSSTAAQRPGSACSPWKASSIDSASVPKKRAAKIDSMDRLTRPAIDIASSTSIRSKRWMRLSSRSVFPRTRDCVSAECR